MQPEQKVETRDQARDRSWWSFDHDILSHLFNIDEVKDARTAHNIGFDAGARWAIMQGSQLSPYVARFIEMLILVGIAEEPAKISDEQLAHDQMVCECSDTEDCIVVLTYKAEQEAR